MDAKTNTNSFGTAVIILHHDEEKNAHQWGDYFLPTPDTVAISSSITQRNRITTHLNIIGGEPFISGSRIPISVILDGLAEGLTPQELIEHYPRLKIEDIRAVREYAAETGL